FQFQIRLQHGRYGGLVFRGQVGQDGQALVLRGPQAGFGTLRGDSCWGDLVMDGKASGAAAARAMELGKALKKNAFNDVSLKCVGKRVTLRINGVTTVDQEFPQIPEEGVLAWNVLSGGTEVVTVRKVEFQDLTRK